jgi:hypothetical protein
MRDQGTGSAEDTDRHNVVVVAVGLTALVAVLVAGDAYGGPVRTSVQYPAGAMAVLGDELTPEAPPTEQPSEPDDHPAVTDAEPVWQVTLPSRVEPRSITTTSAGYVVRTRQQLVAVDADGERLWDYDLVESLDPAKVGQDVVLVSHKHPTDTRWPRPKVVVALDAATGETLWEEDEASFWAAFEDTVFMSVCYGGQNDRIGDCQFSARDLLTNTVRWTTSTYASAQVRNSGGGLRMRPVPDYLVVASYPTGNASRTITTIDPSSGQQRGAGFQGHQDAATAPETLISIEDYDENPADGCTAELTGYRLGSGARAWQYTSLTSKRDDGRSCGRPSSRG